MVVRLIIEDTDGSRMLEVTNEDPQIAMVLVPGWRDILSVLQILAKAVETVSLVRIGEPEPIEGIPVVNYPGASINVLKGTICSVCNGTKLVRLPGVPAEYVSCPQCDGGTVIPIK